MTDRRQVDPLSAAVYNHRMFSHRLQLIELNDSPWVPRPLRDTLIEALSLTLKWGGVLRGLVAPFEEFIAAAGVTEVLDLASGAGGPARILVGEIQRAGRVPPRFVLTDLSPHVEAWDAARAEHPNVITFESTPVDATGIPPELASGRARVIINAFHHFSPDVARGVLADAVASRSPIFIAEGFERNPLGFASMVPVGLAALFAVPFQTPHDRLAKALLVFGAAPVMVAMGGWDGVVSTLRIHSREDLEAMVASLGSDFVWSYGNYKFPLGGRGYYFHGVPLKG